MPVMLERWNDDKMDALDATVKRVDEDLRELRQEMKAGFERLNERFDRIQLLLIQFCGLMLAALIGLIATQI
ncbi:MAG TPA: hypothetical protein VIS95_03200 [Solirubrobacterales bacterium]